MQSTPDNSAGMGEELRSDAQQLGASVTNRMHSEMDARKETAAAQAKSVSSAVERTAGELDENAPAWLKSTLQQGAQQVQRFADMLEQKDSRELVREVRTMARDNPGTFLAGCAAAGFAAARILKAGGDESPNAPNSPQRAFQGQDPMFFQSDKNARSSPGFPGEVA